MTINGINGVNTQIGQMGMNQKQDAYEKNIQRQLFSTLRILLTYILQPWRAFISLLFMTAIYLC